jgi:hypothetical protein
MINEWQGFAQDLERAYGADFVRDLCATFTNYQRAEEEMAFARQKRIAELNAVKEQSWLNGFGELQMQVDPEAYFYWIKRLGRECWTDPGFIREFKRDNPEVVVKCRKRRPSIIRP